MTTARRTIVTAVIVALALPGCAAYRPIVDMRGIDANRYEADLSDCQQLAQQVDAGNHAAGGAVAGALLGAIIGAAIGGRSFASRGAAAYGATGAAAGGAHGLAGQRLVVIRCLQGRGYQPLY